MKKKTKKNGVKQKKEENKDFIEQIKRLPVYWRNIIIISLVGVLVGLVGIWISGYYMGLTIMFFAVSVPVAFYTYKERKRIDDIETHLPDFLRDLAEYNASGVPLSRAILESSKSDYGALTPEIKKIAVEISWGVPFEDALDRFQKRVNSAFVKKAITIMTSAEAQGGEINAILMTLAEDLRRLKSMEEEKKSKLSTYTATIYVIYLLLLMVMVLLTTALAPAIPKMQVASQLFGKSGGGLTEKDFRVLLFNVSLIEAFFAGLISGQMGEGSVIAGLKHSVILVGITMLVFAFIHPAPPMVQMAQTITELPPVSGMHGNAITYEAKFTKSFTVQDIAEQVREIAKNKNLKEYKEFMPSQVEFLAPSCKACARGYLKITPTSIIVKKPVYMKYKIYYSSGKYIIQLSDAQ